MSFRSQPGYVDPLLAVRGLAALGVLLVHCLGRSELAWRPYLAHGWEGPEALRDVLLVVNPTTGKNFVLFFFVHSGYLIGKVFFNDRYDTDAAGISRFYRGRFLRIAPLLWFNLAICLALSTEVEFRPIAWLGEALFLTNYTGRGINSVTWSLAFEMQFYLIAPFIFLAVRKLGWQKLAALLAAALGFELLLAVDDLYLPFDLKDIVPYEFMFFFLSGLAINHALRLWPIKVPPIATPIAIALGFFGGNLAYYVAANSGHEMLARLLLGGSAFFCIWLLELPRQQQRDPLRGSLFGRFWTWIGMLSYGIYLWHAPVVKLRAPQIAGWIEELAVWLPIDTDFARMVIFHSVEIPVVLGLTLLLSYITFILVELRYRPSLFDHALAYRFTPGLRMTRIAGLVDSGSRKVLRRLLPPSTAARPAERARRPDDAYSTKLP